MRKCLFCLIVALLLVKSPLYAHSKESATANAHYAHPVTGIVEDAGNNRGIGQGMCENILHEKALFEEIDGKHYLSVRYHLIDNIGQVSFAVQKKGEKKFRKADYLVVKETAETKDFRFEVPSKDIVVRSGIFVKAMNREVVFYFDFSNFAPGNTDFTPLGEEEVSGSASVEASAKAEELTVPENRPVESGSLGFDHGLLMRDSEEIQRILERNPEMERVHPEEPPSTKAEMEGERKSARDGEWGFVTKTLFQGLIFLLVLITFFSMVAAILTYFYAKHLKQLNTIREVSQYEED